MQFTVMWQVVKQRASRMHKGVFPYVSGTWTLYMQSLHRIVSQSLHSFPHVFTIFLGNVPPEDFAHVSTRPKSLGPLTRWWKWGDRRLPPVRACRWLVLVAGVYPALALSDELSSGFTCRCHCSGPPTTLTSWCLLTYDTITIVT